jgi:periplasmic protein TonB
MASPKEIAPLLPETLPADFSEWDGEGSPASKPREQSESVDAILASFRNSPRFWRSDSHGAVSVRQQSALEKRQREAPAATSRDSDGEREAAKIPGETPRVPKQSAGRKAALSPAKDMPHGPRPALSQRLFAKAQKLTSDLVDSLQSRASHGPKAGQPTKEAPVAKSPIVAPIDGARNSRERSKLLARAADNVPFHFLSTRHREDKAEEKTARNKWLMIAAAGAGSILLPLIVVISLDHHGTKAMAKGSVRPQPAAINTGLEANAPVRPMSEPTTQSKPQATTKQTTNGQQAGEESGVNPAQAPTESQAKMMNAQLTTPRKISTVAENEPPPPASVGVAGADGLGGSGVIDNVFNGHAQPIVKAAKPIAISSVVAAGMLIHQTEPVYPSIAKLARVSGTVELSATITKSGTLKDLQFVSGPEMLRQAALDAVQTWRYRPYKINNEPMEAAVTINVVFSLTY